MDVAVATFPEIAVESFVLVGARTLWEPSDIAGFLVFNVTRPLTATAFPGLMRVAFCAIQN